MTEDCQQRQRRPSDHESLGGRHCLYRASEHSCCVVDNHRVSALNRSAGSGTVRIVAGGEVWVVGEIAINIWYSRRTDAVQNGLLLRNTSKYIQRKFFYSLLATRCYASAGNSDRNVSVCPSVCPSVRLSVTSWYCVKAKKSSWFLHRLVAPWF